MLENESLWFRIMGFRWRFFFYLIIKWVGVYFRYWFYGVKKVDLVFVFMVCLFWVLSIDISYSSNVIFGCFFKDDD